MTYSPETPAQAYIGDGIEVTYNFAYRVDDNPELVVTVDAITQVEGIDYNITTVPTAGVTKYPTGGDIEFTSPPDDLSSILLFRNTLANQLQDYEEFGNFPAKSHEQQLDRSAMRDDEQNAKLSGFIPIGDGFVTSFNSRNGDVVPQGGDYNADLIAETAGRIFTDPTREAKLDAMPASIAIGDLANMTDVGSLDGWTIRKNGAGEWVAVAPILEGFYHAVGYAEGSSNTKRVYFTTGISDTTDNALVTIDNDSTDGLLITALADIIVDITIYYRLLGNNAASGEVSINLNEDNDDHPDAMPTQSAVGRARANGNSTGSNTTDSGTTGSRLAMVNTNTLSIHRENGEAGASQWWIRLSVKKAT